MTEGKIIASCGHEIGDDAELVYVSWKEEQCDPVCGFVRAVATGSMCQECADELRKSDIWIETEEQEDAWLNAPQIVVGVTGVVCGRDGSRSAGTVSEISSGSFKVDWLHVDGGPWFRLPAMMDGGFKRHGEPKDQATRFYMDAPA